MVDEAKHAALRCSGRGFVGGQQVHEELDGVEAQHSEVQSNGGAHVEAVEHVEVLVMPCHPMVVLIEDLGDEFLVEVDHGGEFEVKAIGEVVPFFVE